MAVYVDDLKQPKRQMTLCRMVADDLKELHEFAESIGVLKKSLIGPPSSKLIYYLIAGAKQECAFECGAQKIMTIETISFSSGLYAQWCQKNAPELFEDAQKEYEKQHRISRSKLRIMGRSND